MRKFKVGDRVVGANACLINYKKGGTITNVIDNEYIIFWDYEKSTTTWSENQLEREEKMSIKQRIEALNNGWDKEADDIMRKAIKLQTNIMIHDDSTSRGGWIDVNISMDDKNLDGDRRFNFKGQCEKNRAFKNALLWLADKAGMIEPKEGDKAEVEVDGKKWEATLVRRV